MKIFYVNILMLFTLAGCVHPGGDTSASKLGHKPFESLYGEELGWSVNKESFALELKANVADISIVTWRRDEVRLTYEILGSADLKEDLSGIVETELQKTEKETKLIVGNRVGEKGSDEAAGEELKIVFSLHVPIAANLNVSIVDGDILLQDPRGNALYKVYIGPFQTIQQAENVIDDQIQAMSPDAYPFKLK